MRASRLERSGVQRRGSARPGNQAGAAMMFILLISGLIAVVTTGVLMFVAADVSSGVGHLQATTVFNVAEAGVHYAMANLQGSSANTYAGAIVNITGADGTTVLGTATITVGCIDGTALPCTGAYEAYRRIVSVGTMPASGRTRTIVAVVQGTPWGGRPTPSVGTTRSRSAIRKWRSLATWAPTVTSI